MHTEENSSSQILRSDAFSCKKNEMPNEIFWCAGYYNDPAGVPSGFQTVSDVGSGLLKMVTAVVDAENLTGLIYI